MKIVQFEFCLFGINTYIVYDPTSKECAIIDPGMINSEEQEVIEKYMERNELKLKYIINTHLHIDHVAGDSWVKNRYNAQILAHKDDEVLGNRLEQQAQMFGLPLDVSSIKIDRYLKPGDKIKIGEGELEVIHVPGHSRGSIALYDKEDGFVISGDALFAGSIGRTDLPGGSMPQLLDSIKTRLLTLPEKTLVFSGHGAPTTIGREKQLNPYLK